MFGRFTLAALAGSALVVAGLTALPSAAESQARALSLRPSSALGTFTPASADPRMARALRRAGISSRGLRFTPSASRQGDRPITVAVRSRASATGQAERAAEFAMATTSNGTTAITPSAYNLGVAVGWRRFAISGDVARIDNAVIPGRSREAADVGVSYSGRRWSTRVQFSADRPTAESAPSLVDNEERVAVDVGGSYSIARNLDITGGVRYQRQYRIEQPDDETRDSQAVYIGTAFRF
jgi:hypothetical protein